MTLTRAQWVTLALLVVGIAHAVLTVGFDQRNGHLLGWPLLIGAAFVAGFVAPRHWGWWGVVTVTPLALSTLLGDQVAAASDEGTGSVSVLIVIIQALVATGVALMGAQLAELGATGGVRRTQGRGVIVALSLLGVGVVAAVALSATAGNDEPLESELFWWLWVVLPVAAAVAGRVFPRLSAWWGFITVLPVAALVMVDGALLGETGETSVWLTDVVVLLVLAVWSTLFAMVGAAWSRRAGARRQLETTRG
ncbi:MAG: hypothetical protein OES57_04175 [Acidimicrobiia bacterium]|nr:hypothetical protein [Acidimicrobiia bacterium]